MFVPFKSHICFIKGTCHGWKPHVSPRFKHTFRERGRDSPRLDSLHACIHCELTENNVVQSCIIRSLSKQTKPTRQRWLNLMKRSIQINQHELR